MKKLVLFLLLCAICLGFSTPIKAYTTKYHKVGQHMGSTVSYYNKSSQTVWVGDSRIVQMYNSFSKDSYFAIWGGHYGYGGNAYQIDRKGKIRQIKSVLKQIIKRYGKAYLILTPTINDYSGGKGYKGAFLNYCKTVKKFLKWNRHLVVLTPSLVKTKGGKSCKVFNRALKKIKKAVYVPLKMRGSYYQKDRTHYRKAGLQYIRRRIAKYRKKY